MKFLRKTLEQKPPCTNKNRSEKTKTGARSVDYFKTNNLY